jgi:predicted nucleic acid-binding protein
MRVVLDTNILVSALIAPAGNPAAIYNAWEQGITQVYRRCGR